MFRGKTVDLTLWFVFFFGLSAFGQWSPVNSGTTNNLNGAHLLGSGTGFIVGEVVTILKITKVGRTWVPLISGTSANLHAIYLFNFDQQGTGVVLELILWIVDCRAIWQ